MEEMDDEMEKLYQEAKEVAPHPPADSAADSAAGRNEPHKTGKPLSMDSVASDVTSEPDSVQLSALPGASTSAAAAQTAAQTAPVSSGERALPVGWIAQYDPVTGVPYYAEVATGKSQWEFPIVVAETSLAEACGGLPCTPSDSGPPQSGNASLPSCAAPHNIPGEPSTNSPRGSYAAPASAPAPVSPVSPGEVSGSSIRPDGHLTSEAAQVVLSAVSVEEWSTVWCVLDAHPSAVDCRWDQRDSLLHFAARHGSWAAVERLLHYRAQLDLPSAEGESALQIARRHGHAALVAELEALQAAADSDGSPEEQRPPPAAAVLLRTPSEELVERFGIDRSQACLCRPMPCDDRVCAFVRILYSDPSGALQRNQSVCRQERFRIPTDRVQAHEMLYGPAAPTTSSFDDEQVGMRAPSHHIGRSDCAATE